MCLLYVSFYTLKIILLDVDTISFNKFFKFNNEISTFKLEVLTFRQWLIECVIYLYEYNEALTQITLKGWNHHQKIEY